MLVLNFTQTADTIKLQLISTSTAYQHGYVHFGGKKNAISPLAARFSSALYSRTTRYVWRRELWRPRLVIGWTVAWWAMPPQSNNHKPRRDGQHETRIHLLRSSLNKTVAAILATLCWTFCFCAARLCRSNCNHRLQSPADACQRCATISLPVMTMAGRSGEKKKRDKTHMCYVLGVYSGVYTHCYSNRRWPSFTARLYLLFLSSERVSFSSSSSSCCCSKPPCPLRSDAPGPLVETC